MPTYHVKLRDAQGVLRTGTIRAASPQAAGTYVGTRGFTIIELELAVPASERHAPPAHDEPELSLSEAPNVAPTARGTIPMETCPACQTAVSSRADNCPRCGHPFERHMLGSRTSILGQIAILLFVCALLLLLNTCRGHH